WSIAGNCTANYRCVLRQWLTAAMRDTPPLEAGAGRSRWTHNLQNTILGHASQDRAYVSVRPSEVVSPTRTLWKLPGPRTRRLHTRNNSEIACPGPQIILLKLR